MDAIVAVDKAWAIGYDGQLLQAISADLKRFRRLTTNKILIYGRKTLTSFPNAQPLPKRRNIILSKRPESLRRNNFEVYTGLEELFAALSEDDLAQSFVIGGESVYRQLLPYCKRVYVTKIDHVFLQADAYFPNLDADPNWQATESEEWLLDEASQLRFRYVLYEQVNTDAKEA